MPYSKDSDLPDAVKKLSPEKRKRWMAAFNAAHKQYGTDEKAFAVAWSAVKEGTMDTKGYKNFEVTFDLEEAFANSPRIDKEKGVIENVVILTGNKITRNKTFYTDKALTEAASRYNGAKMFMDHPRSGEANRSIRDYGGIYKNVRREGDKILGDLHVHEGVRNLIIPVAEQRPKGVGLSIRDKGRGREENGVFLVEGFKDGATHSIDFVTEVSSNMDLFESLDTEGGNDMDYSKITKEDLEKNRQDLVEALRSEGKQALAKDLEEANKLTATAEEKLLMGEKLIALSEAGFAKEVADKVRKMIEPKAISLEEAKGIITAQKELIEAIRKSAPSNADPKVTGRGAPRKDVGEGADDLKAPSKEDLAEAFKGNGLI